MTYFDTPAGIEAKLLTDGRTEKVEVEIVI